MSDKMKRRTLIVCAGVLVLCGLPMVVMAVVQRDARMGLYGVMSLLFALSDVLRLFLTADIPPAAPPRPELSITADPVVYRDPVSGERFAVVTISRDGLSMGLQRPRRIDDSLFGNLVARKWAGRAYQHHRQRSESTRGLWS